MRNLFLGLLCCLGGCARQHTQQNIQPQADAEVADAPEAGRRSTRHLAALVGTALGAYRRNVAARCPCHVAHGDYASVTECVEDVGRDALWLPCLAALAEAEDREDLRYYLECFAAGLDATNACLQAAGCAREELAACDALREDCPPPDALLTKDTTQCTEAIGLR